MAKKNGASVICRLITAISASLCFTTLALPFSQMRLPRRAKPVAEAKVVHVSLSANLTPQNNAKLALNSLSQNVELNERLLSEYGAVLMARNGVALPPREMFSSDDEVAQWQATVETSGGDYVLQTAAADALNAAREEARTQNLDITARDTDAAARDYTYTVKL